MPKKCFIILIFFCIYSNLSYAESDFNSKKYHEVVLDNLSLKEIMRNFYYEGLSYMSGVMYEEIEDENTMLRYEEGYEPKLKEIGNSILITMPDKYNKNMIQTYSSEGYFGAELSPMQEYKNAQGEERYLIGVMIVGLNENYTEIKGTHGAMSITDFYVFKRVHDGRYQLVSRSKEDKEPTNSSCRNDASFLYPVNNIKIQKIGGNIVGGIFNDCFVMQANYSNNWMILQLLEDDYINVNYIDKAGSNMLEEEHPLYYDYDSDLRVVENNQKYYPLFIHYKGEMPVSDNNSSRNRIKTVDYISKWIFDENKKEYSKEVKDK